MNAVVTSFVLAQGERDPQTLFYAKGRLGEKEFSANYFKQNISARWKFLSPSFWQFTEEEKKEIIKALEARRKMNTGLTRHDCDELDQMVRIKQIGQNN
jgi:hypothetical protein